MHALPGAVPEKPLVNGRAYVGGGISDPLPVEKALSLGADRFLVVLTIPPGAISRKATIVERLATRRYFKDSPGLLEVCDRRNDPLTRSLDLLENLERNNPGSVLVMRPPEQPPGGPDYP